MLKLKETLPVNSVRPRVILCHIMLTVTMRFLQYFIRNYLVCLKRIFCENNKKKNTGLTHTGLLLLRIFIIWLQKRNSIFCLYKTDFISVANRYFIPVSWKFWRMWSLCSIVGSTFVLSEVVMKIKSETGKDGSSPWITGRSNLKYNEVHVHCMWQITKNDR